MPLDLKAARDSVQRLYELIKFRDVRTATCARSALGEAYLPDALNELEILRPLGEACKLRSVTCKEAANAWIEYHGPNRSAAWRKYCEVLETADVALYKALAAYQETIKKEETSNTHREMDKEANKRFYAKGYEK